MNPWLAELIGTAIMIYLGSAVVANTILDKTKGKGGGIIVIALGWALAVMIPAIIFSGISGAHFNPALTLAIAMNGGVYWHYVPMYVLAQFVGAAIGATLTWIQYKDHFDITEDKDAKLACFSNSPAIKNTPINLISEIFATFLLVFTLIGIENQTFAYGTNFFALGGIILAIGVALGGTTGYAINPARDLGPRIAFVFFKIQNKPSANWSYAWIPVIGPLIGAVLAGFLVGVLF
ncbi:MAG: aquaporin family protein [Defluviitaleaceae bacterium]|nr:aquaporin family protein [Defluviitaleaceae bacterium]